MFYISLDFSVGSPLYLASPLHLLWKCDLWYLCQLQATICSARSLLWCFWIQNFLTSAASFICSLNTETLFSVSAEIDTEHLVEVIHLFTRSWLQDLTVSQNSLLMTTNEEQWMRGAAVCSYSMRFCPDGDRHDCWSSGHILYNSYAHINTH